MSGGSRDEIWRMPVEGLSRAVRQRELSAREVAQAYLEQAQEKEADVRAFLWLDSEAVLEAARRLDAKLDSDRDRPAPLAGVPVAVKDVISTRGIPTTCGSRILQGYLPPYDASVVERLKQAGALIFGKTNCDEFAMGSSTENSAYRPTRNPWDGTRVPGGSSGGSAACVAAAQVPLSLGTDTGGSIRQPAAFCGVVGLKPTYGRVSRYGLVAFASSLDQIGPFGRSVRDVALLLQVIAGPDPRDSTCSTAVVEDYTGEIEAGFEKPRVGIVKDWLAEGLEPEVRAAVEKAVEELSSMGCPVEEIQLPHNRHSIAAYYIIAPAEASSNLARYDGVRYGFRTPQAGDLESMYRNTRSTGFGAEVKRRIMLGTYVLSAGYYDAYFIKAARVRRLILQDLEKAFEKVDLLVGPTTPTPAFKIGERTEDPVSMYLSDIYTVTANLAGIPALSLPCGFCSEGLPLGVQLLAPHFQESRLLRTAHRLEQSLKSESQG